MLLEFHPRAEYSPFSASDFSEVEFGLCKAIKLASKSWDHFSGAVVIRVVYSKIEIRLSRAVLLIWAFLFLMSSGSNSPHVVTFSLVLCLSLLKFIIEYIYIYMIIEPVSPTHCKIVPYSIFPGALSISTGVIVKEYNLISQLVVILQANSSSFQPSRTQICDLSL